MARTKQSLQRELHEAEAAIDEAQIEGFEAWCKIAQELTRIKGNGKTTGLFRGDGFSTWEAYCRSDQARYNKRHANRMIVALKYRRSLPDPGPRGPGWTEKSVRPLTKLSSPAVAKAVASQIIRDIEQWDGSDDEPQPQLTEKYIAGRVRDYIASTPREERLQEEKAAAKLADATLEKNLNKLLKYTQDHLRSLSNLPDSAWSEAEKESPGICGRVAKALRELASFLDS